ncbi:S41 family peptidase [Prolixibacteraceae bacterium]|nr:S41 family peptidase [Prolixibacteraceae bacterium]
MRQLFQYLLLFSILIHCSSVYAQMMYEKKTVVTNESVGRILKMTEAFHPCPQGKMTKRSYRLYVDSVVSRLPKDSLPYYKSLAWVKACLEPLREYDPNVRISLGLSPKDSRIFTSYKLLPFGCMNISDTLIVKNSIAQNLYRGDRILSVEGILAKKLIRSYYEDRYFPNMNQLQFFNGILLKDSYNLKVERDNRVLDITVKGATKGRIKYMNDREPSVALIDGVGYISIPIFYNNKRCYKKLRSLLQKMQMAGSQDLIIDLRENSGGSDKNIDLIFSLLSNKDSLHLFRDAKVKNSQLTANYGFPKKYIGKLFSLRKQEDYCSILSLDGDLYAGPVNCYVLVSKYTGAIAASFANQIQYNSIGVLMGEDLEFGALNYGNITKIGLSNGSDLLGILQLSTAAFDPYSRNKNHHVRVDISIPYVAKDYMKSDDPTLDKAVRYIQKHRK